MAVFQPLNAKAMYTSETANGRKGTPPGASGAFQVGQPWWPKISPPTMKPPSNSAFSSANAFWVVLDHRMSMACDAVASTITAIDTTIGFTPGTSEEKHGPAVDAASATGAENPTSNDVQPASEPSAGCHRSERYRYSPPERGMAAAMAA